jgi:hypothetical protein
VAHPNEIKTSRATTIKYFFPDMNISCFVVDL